MHAVEQFWKPRLGNFYPEIWAFSTQIWVIFTQSVAHQICVTDWVQTTQKRKSSIWQHFTSIIILQPNKHLVSWSTFHSHQHTHSLIWNTIYTSWLLPELSKKHDSKQSILKVLGPVDGLLEGDKLSESNGLNNGFDEGTIVGFEDSFKDDGWLKNIRKSFEPLDSLGNIPVQMKHQSDALLLATIYSKLLSIKIKLHI